MKTEKGKRYFELMNEYDEMDTNESWEDFIKRQPIPREKEIGSSSIIISQTKGDMTVHHGDGSGELLYSRTMYRGEWDELWNFIENPNPYESGVK